MTALAVSAPIGPVARIQVIVAEAYKVPRRIMLTHKGGQWKGHSWPRQVAMYVARRRTNKSFAKIGELFGGLDHSTVWYAVKKVEKRIGEDLVDRSDIASILAIVASSEAIGPTPDGAAICWIKLK